MPIRQIPDEHGGRGEDRGTRQSNPVTLHRIAFPRIGTRHEPRKAYSVDICIDPQILIMNNTTLRIFLAIANNGSIISINIVDVF